MTAVCSAADEAPVVFGSAGQSLFGVLTFPRRPNGAGVVVLQGGGFFPSPGRNRMWVRAARALAADGFHVLRFEYHGVGESTGVLERYRLDRPATDDLAGAMTVMREHGIERLLLVGYCFGARTALASLETAEGVAGVLLLSCPVRDFAQGEESLERLARTWTVGDFLRRAARRGALKGMFDRRLRSAYRGLVLAKVRSIGRSRRPATRRVTSPLYRSGLRAAVQRRIPTLLVYGEADLAGEEFRAALASDLAPILAGAEDLVKVEMLPGRVHGFPALAVQADVLRLIAEWARRAERGEQFAR